MTRNLLLSLGALLLALTATTWSPQAAAQVSVIPCTLHLINGTGTSFGCASEYTVNAQYQYLSTGRNLSLTGVLGLNDGVIEQLRLLNQNVQKTNEGDRQGTPNDDLASRQRDYSLKMRDGIEPYTRPLSEAACYEATVGGGVGGSSGGGGGAAAATKNAGDNMRDALQEDILTPKTESDYVAKLVTSPTFKNYCTEADQKNKIPGCASVGSLPGSDTDPTVLMEAAGPSGTRNMSIKPSPKKDSVSDPAYPQYSAVMDYIQWSKPRSAPDVSAASKDSAAGKLYLIYQRRYNSRTLAVANTLQRIAAMSMSMDPGNPFVKNAWNGQAGSDGSSVKQDFADIYGPKVKFPDAPSEREIMELMVLRQYAPTLASKDMASNDADYYARRQLELQKLNAYLLLKINEREEWNNILLAHLLSNDIDPVKRDELLRLSVSASSATKPGGQ